MKKVRLLQIAVYISFSVFFIQNFSGDFIRGFKEGYNDGEAIRTSGAAPNSLLPSVTIGNLISNDKNGMHQINNDYSMENISISADVRVSNHLLNPPRWLLVCKVIIVLSIVVLLFIIAGTINKVIYSIVNVTMFQNDCQKLLNRAGALLVIFAIVDYIFQQISYEIQTHMVNAPFSVINSSAFNFEILVCAFLLLIIAEAFKQGSKLKEEHDLTI